MGVEVRYSLQLYNHAQKLWDNFKLFQWKLAPQAISKTDNFLLSQTAIYRAIYLYEPWALGWMGENHPTPMLGVFEAIPSGVTGESPKMPFPNFVVENWHFEIETKVWKQANFSVCLKYFYIFGRKHYYW